MPLDMLAMKNELYGFVFYACLDRDIFPIYLLFSVLVLPDIWLMMEALLFVIAELDRFGFRTELVFTVKLTAGKIKTRKNVKIQIGSWMVHEFDDHCNSHIAKGLFTIKEKAPMAVKHWRRDEKVVRLVTYNLTKLFLPWEEERPWEQSFLPFTYVVARNKKRPWYNSSSNSYPFWQTRMHIIGRHKRKRILPLCRY